MLFIGQSVGNVVGPQLYTPAEAPGYARGLRSNLALYVVIVVLVAITTLYLAGLNRAHARRRVALGKSAVVVDQSLDSPEEVAAAAAATARRRREGSASGTGPGQVGEGADDAAAEQQALEEVGAKAFENMTDLKNEDFVFVY